MKFLFLVMTCLFFSNVFAKRNECFLDDANIARKSFNSIALKYGDSVKNLGRGRVQVILTRDSLLGIDSIEYSCSYKKNLGGFHCNFIGNQVADGFFMIKNRGDYQVYDYYYNANNEIVLKKSMSATFICN